MARAAPSPDSICTLAAPAADLYATFTLPLPVAQHLYQRFLTAQNNFQAVSAYAPIRNLALRAPTLATGGMAAASAGFCG